MNIKDQCDRCGTKSLVSIMSMMNTDWLCPECKKQEKAHPRYRDAVEAEMLECMKGNLNYPGLFAGKKYPFTEDDVHAASASRV